MTSHKYRGELVENRIVLWNIEQSRNLFTSGFYGKPLGVPKPKGADFDAPLILDLIEGYYLLNENLLKVLDCTTRKSVSKTTLMKKCNSEYVEFNEKYLVYKTLRDMGYIVTPGIKFGSDFAVYEHGPGIDHAPFIVQVMNPSDNISATAVVLAGRLATTVRKQFLIALAELDQKKVRFVSFDWWRA